VGRCNRRKPEDVLVVDRHIRDAEVVSKLVLPRKAGRRLRFYRCRATA
jgi:hypothetical protein